GIEHEVLGGLHPLLEPLRVDGLDRVVGLDVDLRLHERHPVTSSSASAPDSTIASDRPALALAPELSPLLLKIVGDHDEHPEGPAEQDAGDHVAQLEQPEPAVVEE